MFETEFLVSESVICCVYIGFVFFCFHSGENRFIFYFSGLVMETKPILRFRFPFTIFLGFFEKYIDKENCYLFDNRRISMLL